MFSLSPQNRSSVRYYVGAFSQEKAALRSRRRARRRSERYQQQTLLKQQ